MHPTQMVESDLLLTDVLGIERGAIESKQRYRSALNTHEENLIHAANRKSEGDKMRDGGEVPSVTGDNIPLKAVSNEDRFRVCDMFRKQEAM